MKSNAGDLGQCPCCKECKDCTPVFQKVVDLKNAGLVIYRHTTQIEDLNKETGIIEFAEKTTEDVFILHNTKDMDITSADCFPEIEQNKINCPRCRRIVEHAQKLLKKVPTINRNDVKGVCDHCKMKEAPCFECEEVIKKFIGRKNERVENTKERVKQWLTKIKHLLKDSSVDPTDTRKHRVYSEIYIDQLCRQATPGVSHEPEVIQMFPPKKQGSDFVGAFPPTIDKRNKMFVRGPDLEKVEHSVAFLDTQGGKPPIKTKGRYDTDLFYSDSDSVDLRAMFHYPQADNQSQTNDRYLREHVMRVPFQSEEDFIASRSDDSFANPRINQNIYRRPIGPKSRYASDEDINVNMKRFLKSGKPQKVEVPGKIHAYYETKPAKYYNVLKHTKESESASSTVPGSMPVDYTSPRKYVKQEMKTDDQRQKQDRKASIASLKAKKEHSSIKDKSPKLIRKYHSEEALLTTIDGVTKDDLKQGFMYYFPKQQSAIKKLKRQKSSSELIKDTQDKLQAKAEEEEIRLERQLKIKKEEEAAKQLARNERKKEREEKKIADKDEKGKRHIDEKEESIPIVSTVSSKSKIKDSRSDTEKKEPKSKMEVKESKEKKTPKQTKTPPESKSSKEPKAPPEPKPPKEPKAPPEPKPPREPKAPPEPKPPKEPKAPPEPKLPKEPKPLPEPKPPKEPKAPPEPKLPKEPKAPPEPKLPKEPKPDKGAEKDLKEKEKKEKEEKAKKEKEEKEKLKKEKEEQARIEKDVKQKEKDLQQRQKEELQRTKQDHTMQQKNQEDKSKLKDEEENKAREEARLQLKKERDAEAEAKLKVEPEKVKPPKLVEQPKTKELNINQVKVRKPSGDDLLLQLVRIKQSMNADRIRPKRLSDMKLSRKDVTKHMSYHKNKRGACFMCLDSDIEIDAESIFMKKDGEQMADIIRGEKIYKYKPPLVENKEDPNPALLFKSTFDSATAPPIPAEHMDMVSPKKPSPVTTATAKQAKGVSYINRSHNKEVLYLENFLN